MKKLEYNEVSSNTNTYQYDKGAIFMGSSDVDPSYERVVNRPVLHREVKFTVSRFNFGLSLISKVIILCLCIGFIWFMNERPFDFHLLVEGATTQNFIQGWDYQESIHEINVAFDKIRLDNTDLPDWLTNLFNGVVEFILGFRYLCILVVSLAYVVGWLFGFIWYMLGSL